MCMPIILAVFYLSTRFAGCSVDPKISYGACKLIRTPRVKKKKKKRKKKKKAHASSLVPVPAITQPPLLLFPSPPKQSTNKHSPEAPQISLINQTPHPKTKTFSHLHISLVLLF